MTASTTTGGRACGWSPSRSRTAAGARAPCSSWKSRPSTRHSTTSCCSGIRLDKPKPGQELLFSYRLYWGTKMPYSSPLAQTIATRTGIGGTVGVKRQYYSWHFAVDFAGGELGALPKDAPVEAVITASRGQTEHVTAHYVEEFHGYRALFDIRPTDDGASPSICGCILRLEGQAADRNLDLSVDAAVGEGTQAGHR